MLQYAIKTILLHAPTGGLESWLIGKMLATHV